MAAGAEAVGRARRRGGGSPRTALRSLTRNSLGITALQRSLTTGQDGRNGFGGGVGGVGNGLNGINGSSSIITTVEGADLWHELRVAMRALVFHVGEDAAPAGAGRRLGSVPTGPGGTPCAAAA